MNKALLVFVTLFYIPYSYSFDFELPPGSSSTVVSADTSTMGMRISIRKFENDMTVESILSFYKNLWGGSAVVSQLSQWQMIGTVKEGAYYNVQVQRGISNSWGYISISDLPESLAQGTFLKRLKAANIPKMAGSLVLDNQYNSDRLKNSQTSFISNRFSLASNSQFYINYYRQRGWSVKQDSQQTDLKGRLILLSKGSQSLTLTVQAKNGLSNIVMNITEVK